jgi:hypothetical protein
MFHVNKNLPSAASCVRVRVLDCSRPWRCDGMRAFESRATSHTRFGGLGASIEPSGPPDASFTAGSTLFYSAGSTGVFPATKGRKKIKVLLLGDLFR